MTEAKDVDFCICGRIALSELERTWRESRAPDHGWMLCLLTAGAAGPRSAVLGDAVRGG